MSNPDLIHRLAELRMLSSSYVDYKGQYSEIPVGHKELILNAMGYQTETDQQLNDAIDTIDKEHWFNVLGPVTVLVPNRPWGIDFAIPTAQAFMECQWSMKLEGQASPLTGEFIPHKCEHLDVKYFESEEYVRKRLLLPKQLPLGYHQITLTIEGKSHTCPLIVTPLESFQSTWLSQNNKIWGTAIQLYTLKSEENWGIGDFGDLLQLIDDIAENGGDVIGLNPVHALFPNNPQQCSPYSPSNRSMMNVLYINVEQVPEFDLAPGLQKWLSSQKIQKRIKSLRSTEMVDYPEVNSLKFEAFRQLFDVFETRVWGKGDKRDKKFRKFVKEGGSSLSLQCLFDALSDHFVDQGHEPWGWSFWPEAYHDSKSAEVKAFADAHETEIRFYMYLQFVADEQMAKAFKKSKSKNMKLGLYKDLAVGSNPGGAEVWSSKDRFCLTASVGAPPDPLGPTGQNWGLPPLDPTQLRNEAYQTFITLVRNNMKSCNGLRIDHAMALFRLWWCPPGKDANEGGYVEFHLHELLGILNLESVRHQCVIIAEDLGTVPEQIKEGFPVAKLYSNKVFIFETGEYGCTRPEHYPHDALAMVVNHDMPTINAFWNMSDLELRQKLGMFDSEDSFHHEKNGRNWVKSAMLRALAEQGLLPAGISTDPNEVPEMTLELSQALHAYVARCNANIMVVQLEDMQLINKPVNVPGTSTEYPNWQRKLAGSSQALFARDDIKRFCTAMSQNRRH